MGNECVLRFPFCLADDLPLRPNPGPEALPPEFDWTTFAFWALLLGLVACGTLLAMRWWRRRPRPILAPHETALAELDRIATGKLANDKDIEQHYVRIAEVLRRYLGSRFEIPWQDRTTRELTSALQTIKHLTSEQQHSVAELLNQADLVKFARQRPDETEANLFLTRVREFIKTTAPTRSA